MAKPKIFVSHSAKDNDFATRLVNHLNIAGAQAWMDTNDLGAGNFQQSISEALTDCEWFVLVLTRNALASDWVRMEVDAAIRLKHQKRINELVFVKASNVDLTEIPALWGVFNVFDAIADYSIALIKVLKSVGLISEPYTIPTVSSWSPTYPLGTVGQGIVPGVAGAIGGAVHEVGAIEHGIANHLPGHHSSKQEEEPRKGAVLDPQPIERGIASYLPGHRNDSAPTDVAEWTCNQCGNKSAADHRFCDNCGYPKL